MGERAPTPASASAPAATPTSKPPTPAAAPAPASTLSPLASPFYPTSGGRPKALRWMEPDMEDDDLLVLSSEDEEDVRRPLSYRDAALKPAASPTPAAAAPPPAATSSQVRLQSSPLMAPAPTAPPQLVRRRPAWRSCRRRARNW